jgi:hypothetical protein
MRPIGDADHPSVVRLLVANEESVHDRPRQVAMHDYRDVRHFFAVAIELDAPPAMPAWKRGLPRLSPEVDAENASGALRLYESVGTHVETENVIYEKEIGTP